MTLNSSFTNANMLPLLLLPAFFFGSAKAKQILAGRQSGQEGAFVPDLGAPVATCAELGVGFLACGTEDCYNPDLGGTCCADGCPIQTPTTAEALLTYY